MKSFLAGIGLGFGVGLMLAPQEGSATRRKLMEKLGAKVDDLRQGSAPIVSEVAERVKGWVDSSKQAASDPISHASDESSQLLEILNSASKTRLMSVSGIGDATARRIIESRPYDSADILVRDGILSDVIMAALKKTLLVDEEAA